MSLPSWGGLTEMARCAAANRACGPYAARFFAEFHGALRREESVHRSAEDKQALVGCIKAGMGAASAKLIANHPSIWPCSYRIEVPGLRRGKSPDYAFTNGSRFYLIEQKSVLRFNEFAQVFLEALLAHRKHGDKVRFAGLFNYLHQERRAFEQLSEFEGRCLIHRIAIVVPERSYTACSPQEVESLFEDILQWLA